MSVRKLSAKFDNAQSFDNNNNNNKVKLPKKRPSINIPKSLDTNASLSTNIGPNKLTETCKKPVSVGTKKPPLLKPVIQQKNVPERENSKDEIKTNKSVFKFKNLFENKIQDNGVSKNNNITQKPKIILTNAAQNSTKYQTNTRNDSSSTQSMKISTISSGVAKDNFKALLTKKLQNPFSTKEEQKAPVQFEDDSSNLNHHQYERTSSKFVSSSLYNSQQGYEDQNIERHNKMAESDHSKVDTSSRTSSKFVSSSLYNNQQDTEDQNLEMHNKMAKRNHLKEDTASGTSSKLVSSSFYHNQLDTEDQNLERHNKMAENIHAKKDTASGTSSKCMPSFLYHNQQDTKHQNLERHNKMAQVDRLKEPPNDWYLAMNAFKSQNNDFEARGNLKTEELPPRLPHRIPKSFTSRSSTGESSGIYLNRDQVKEISKDLKHGVQVNMEHEWENVEEYKYDYAEDLSLPFFSRKNTPTATLKNPSPLLPYKFPVVPTVETERNVPTLPPRCRSGSNNTRSPLPIHKNATHGINSPRIPIESNRKVSNVSSSPETTPPLPPRSSSMSKPSTVSSTKSTLTPGIVSPDYPVFSPGINTSGSSTQSILQHEVNPFTFTNVNSQKSFTDELRKEQFKNEQVQSSNSVEVEGMISDIIYGRKSLKFRGSKDDHFFRDAVRLSHLSLQSDETLSDDFDSDDSWDDSPEPIDNQRPFSFSLEEIPLEKLLKNKHTQNLKWTQIMEKFQINIQHLTERERSLQDAKYELISSEWSFFKALNILYGQFVEKLFIVLSKNEENKLFAYVKEVKDCSEKLLKNIEASWKNNAFMDNFCYILSENLECFDVYVHYCCNQIYSETLLGEIVSDKTRTFKEFLDDIQRDPVCNGLHLHAYQLVPVRKINSFPSLLENILRYLSPNDREYQICQSALNTTNQLLHRCNSETKLAKEHVRTKTILAKLEFPKNSLLKLDQGDVHMRNFIKSDKMELGEMGRTLFGKKFVKTPVYVFLFNDIFVVARKSSANKYMVLDYCFRINMELDANPIYLNLTIGSIDLNTIFYLHIKENRDLKPREMILSCKTRTDAVRWIEALDPPDSARTDESFNFSFIRKVIVQSNYSAVHSDEISLTIGEKYTILRETDDGWSFGQREKDGECGWFQTENVLLVDDVRQRVTNVKKKYQNSNQR